MSDRSATPDSVRSRYIVTLGAQIFRLLLSVVSATLVPRTLGPAVYGNYSFLLSTAATLRGLFDNCSQQAFFTFSSQQRASGPLTKLYGLVLLAQLAAVLLIVTVAALTGTTGWLWHAQLLDQIVWVTILDWVVFLAASLQQLGDSKGLTVNLQLIGAAVSLVTIAGLLLVWATGRLDFYTFAWLNLTSAAVTCALLGYWLLVRNRELFWSGPLEIRTYVQRWWRFAAPVIPLQYYLPVVAYLGVYLIQHWYGSQEQGYYGLALQWSTFALLFTNAAVWIFWREIAHHTASGDASLAADTYRQFSQLFFFLSVVLACWLSACSAMLVRMVAGERYAQAGGVLAVMAFYPVAQTLGQLTMTALKATERTASYARWCVLLSVPDLLLTYFLLAPADARVPGLHLGALGLACKTAVYGLASVQFYDLLNCRYLGVSYPRELASKLLALVVIALIAFVALNRGSAWLVRTGMAEVTALSLASCLYGAAVVLVAWQQPRLMGLKREQIVRGVQLLKLSRVART
jgi:O-antigen/teichoic acid export membrane protein